MKIAQRLDKQWPYIELSFSKAEAKEFAKTTGARNINKLSISLQSVRAKQVSFKISPSKLNEGKQFYSKRSGGSYTRLYDANKMNSNNLFSSTETNYSYNADKQILTVKLPA